MRDLLIFAIAFGASLAALRRPYVGVLAWTWISLMNPHRDAWGFMLNFPVAMMIAIATLVGLVVSSDKKHLPLTSISTTQLLLIVWFCVTSAFALYPEEIGEQFSKVMKIQLMTLVTLALVHTRQQIQLLIWVATGSLAFFGVKGGIFTILTGGNFRVWGPDGTFIGDNNSIALALVMTIPLLYALYKMSSRALIRWGLLGSIGLSSIATIGTHSRGGFLAAGAMTAVLWWRSGRRVALAVPIAVGAAIVLSVMPTEWWGRMGTIATYEEDASAMGRINAWSMALGLAADRFTGGGFYVFTQELFDRYSSNPEDGVRAAHSIYFQILGEHGWIGLAIFVLLWINCWRTANWLMKNGARAATSRWVVPVAAMIQVSFVGYLVGGAFLSLAYFDLPYLLAVILVACQHLVKRELKTEEAHRQFAQPRAGPAQEAPGGPPVGESR